MKIPRITILIPLLTSGWLIAEEPIWAPAAATATISKKEKSRVILPERKKSEREPIRIRELDTRAWTTVVGWRPSESAFPEPKTHESTLYLFSLGGQPSRVVANVAN